MMSRKEVKRDEKDHEQRSSHHGGILLEQDQEKSGKESREGMPQVKGLKELRLPVRQPGIM